MKFRRQLRLALNCLIALTAMAVYGRPQSGLQLIGVTGTDGKTTTVRLLASMLRQAGRQVGVISTVGVSINDQHVDLPAHVSTPGPWQLYRLLRDMKRHGVNTVIIEVTSHGLDQRRIFGLHFMVGVVTNISPEHMDYHGSLAKYAAAKARLCRLSQAMVLNGQDKLVRAMAGSAQDYVLFGVQDGSAVWADGLVADSQLTRFRLHLGDQQAEIVLPLVGPFNVQNALAACGAAKVLGLPLSAMIDGLAAVKGVAGRWQIVQDQPFAVVVDFGHTPQAFEQILPVARSLAGPNGRVIHLFGCAGGRDAGKRQVMGELSGRLADLSVVTMEDPRYELLDRIQQSIIAGLEQAGKHEGQGWVRIDDRRQAIDWAVAQARSGDVVLLTGKGHEKSMAIGDQEQPWDEVAIAKQAIAAR
jgi:UDP-N-acetylmuramoyl-L-alanyl-D-glutamate--2,6-diaminopimelate ligase